MNNGRKFTLIELMVAIAVFTVFMVLIVQFFVVASRLWNASEKETQMSGKANLALSAIEQFIRNAKLGASSAPFFVNDAVDSSGDLQDLGKIMKNRFDGIRWEQDQDAYENDKSAKLVLAASSYNVLVNGAGNFYLVCFVQAQDRLQLRVISDLNDKFSAHLGESRDTLLKRFEQSQSDFLGINDNNGSGMLGKKAGEDRNGKGKVTYDLINHVTRFRVYPMVLNSGFSTGSSGNSGSALKIMNADDLDGTKPYAILVEISLLGDDDFNSWKELMAAGMNSNGKEPDEAREFRNKAERTFSRLIYVGSVKEV